MSGHSGGDAELHAHDVQVLVTQLNYKQALLEDSMQQIEQLKNDLAAKSCLTVIWVEIGRV